jgi:glycosyltransferase involved in cell wall biosynthesis
MKLAIVSNLYPPVSRGGAEQIAHRVAREMRALGHDVFVVSTRREPGSVPRVTESNVERVYRFRPRNLYHPLGDHAHGFPVRAAWHLIDLFGAHPARALGRVLDQERPDAVITHNLKGFGLRAVSAIRERGLRHMHTVHDVQLAVPSGLLIRGHEHDWLNDGAAQRWYQSAVRRTFGSPAVVVSPSRFLADFYASRGFFPESRVEIVPNPAPNVQPPPRGTRRPGPLRLLFAGQLETHKGVKFLLEALNAVSLPIELHVAGEGALTAYVDQWARRDARVIYHGFCSLDNLVKLFSICDATVVPSLCYENSPTVIYESFQTGVPVVAANIGGVGELVRDRENGYLFAPGNRGEFTLALERLARDEDGFWSRSEAIRSGVADRSLGEYAKKIVELLK